MLLPFGLEFQITTCPSYDLDPSCNLFCKMGSASTKFRKYLQNGDEYAAMQVFQSSPELQRSLNPNLSYGDSYQHNTPLHFAAKHAMKHLLRTFLNDLGGNPNKKNSKNETCLHSACQMSQTKSLSAHDRRYACVVLVLQWRGAALTNGEVEKIDLATSDEKNNTALHYAAASGLKRCVELLVVHGAPLFSENNDKETPCDCAEKAGHESIAVYLESKMVFADTSDTVNEADLLNTLECEEPYSGLRAQDLQEAKDQLLVETSDMLHVPLFTAEALLRDNEWSRETLLENWIKEPITCCERAGVHPPTSALQFTSVNGDVVTPEIVTTEYQEETLNSPIRLTSAEIEAPCEICTGSIPPSDEPVPMICDHRFCHPCWERYLNVKIQDGDAHNIMCPAFGCMRLVPVDVIEKLVAPDMVRRYLQFDIKAFVDSNPNIKWCPYPGCGRAVRLPENEILHPEPIHIPNLQPPLPTSHAVDCGNGHFFCWECLDIAHAPCGCSKWVDWHKKIAEIKPEELRSTFVDTEDAANCLWLVSNSKPCPNCKSPIQKNEGCNHMKCSKCKFDFCWVCLEAWKKHNSATGGYFRCNRFDAVHRAEERHGILISAAEMRNKQMQELNRFVHYYTRFKNHENNHKLEEPLLKTAKDKMVMLATSVPESPGVSGENETRFIEYAVSELLKARRVLCGSYVYGYYLEDNGYNRTIFEFMQNELEDCTEKLAQMVARPYLQTPRAKIIQTASLVKRKRQEFTIAVSKGLIPPETPPTMRRFRRRRFPGLMGMDPIEDEQLSQAIAASLHDLDPENPWVKDGQGRHTNLAAIYDWPDYDSDEEVDVNNALAASILGICSRRGCTKPRARNPRTGALHDYCSLRCSKLDKLGNSEESILSYTSDFQMDLLIALEMSRLQMIEDKERLTTTNETDAVDVEDQGEMNTELSSILSDNSYTPDSCAAMSRDPDIEDGSMIQDHETGNDSESPLNTLENLGDQVTLSDEQVDSEPSQNIPMSPTGENRDLTIGSSNGDLAWNFVDSNESAAIKDTMNEEQHATSPPSPRTNADLAVEYFLKSLGDQEGYLKNINVNHTVDSKADKELIKFCKNVTKSAENINNPDSDGDGVRRKSPRCSCMMHSEASDSSSSQVLWEVQGASTSSSSSSSGHARPHFEGSESDEVFGKLKKSPTDSSLCFDPRSKNGRIGSMSWDMSMSLETLSKKSSSAFRRLTKSETKKPRLGSQDREKTSKKWLDWQFF